MSDAEFYLYWRPVVFAVGGGENSTELKNRLNDRVRRRWQQAAVDAAGINAGAVAPGLTARLEMGKDNRTDAAPSVSGDSRSQINLATS